jgi:hypothetical protein
MCQARLIARHPGEAALLLVDSTWERRRSIPRARSGHGVSAREDGLRELLDDWSPEQEAELDERLTTLARDCIDQDAARLRHDEGLREAA